MNRLTAGPNLFTNTAEFYDLDSHYYSTRDVGFYLTYAQERPGRVLELACGTGRVSIPLAQAGVPVYGIDLSSHMLARFRIKLGELPSDAASRVHLAQADMADFDLGEQFELIIVPYRGFQALTSDRAVRSCLRAVKRHLTDDGLFIVDVYDPRDDLERTWSPGETIDWVLEVPELGGLVTRTSRRLRLDRSRQISYSEAAFYVSGPEGDRELVDRFELRYYRHYQMQVLLAASGFTIVQSFGDYDRRPAGSGPELIFACKKTRMPVGLHSEVNSSTRSV